MLQDRIARVTGTKTKSSEFAGAKVLSADITFGGERVTIDGADISAPVERISAMVLAFATLAVAALMLL